MGKSEFVAIPFLLMTVTLVINCQSLPRLEHRSESLPNNSYISYSSISYGEGALKCVTDSDNCCSDSGVGVWRDERGRAVHQGADEATCLYVTRGQGEVRLNRNSSCIPETSGLWRCDVPDSSDKNQSIYIYISISTAYGKVQISFIL